MRSRRFTSTFSLAIVGLFAAIASSLMTFAADRPNIIFVLADDMGFGDVQSNNVASKIPTPNLDRLANEGMNFVDAHTPSAVCTPTRYGLVTGRYCWRSPLKRGVLNGYGEPLIETDRQTVAAFLKSNGYHTGIVGKWHLGLGFAKGDDGKSFDFSKDVSHGPHTLGFDDSFVIPASLDFPPYIYIRDGSITEFPGLTQPAQPFPAFLRRGERSADFVMEDCLDDLLSEAVGFIERRAGKDKPFFLYFPLTAPHKPVLPHPRFRGKTELGPYGDFVMQVDWTVGQVLNAVDKNQITENTLVIFSSDNGSYMVRIDDETSQDHVDDDSIQAYRADRHTANYQFRGTKADIWEAGHHVPFFARWPAKIKPGSSCSETICLTDFFATTADIIKAEPAEGAAQDSFSVLSLLEGRGWDQPRDPVIHHSAGGMFAIRDGKWKLVLGNGSGGRQLPKGKPFEKPYALHNMTRDISEQTNVAERYPEVVGKLEQKIDSILGGDVEK